MHILFLIDSLKKGGKEKRLLNLINSLPSDIKFTLVLLQRYIDFDTSSIEDKIEIYSGKNNIISKMIWLYNLFGEKKIDVVHSWYHECSRIALPVCKIKQIPFITSEITNVSPPSKRKWSKYQILKRIIFRYSDYIISNSKAGLLAYDAPVHKSIVIYNGINPSNQFVKSNVIDKINTKIILMIANFTEKKDYSTFLKVAVKMSRQYPDLMFIGVGGGKLLVEYKTQIPDELKEKIIFPGAVSNVMPYIQSAKIGVLLSFGEGFPNSVMEMMNEGKPVIVTKGGGVNELIDHGHNGMLIEQRDAIQLEKSIIYLLNNSKQSELIGENARNDIRTKYSLDKMVNSFIDLYRKK